MKTFANLICKHKLVIVILTLVLLIPSMIGMYKTKVNYDILVYLPDDIETLKGEKILTDDFNMGAFSVTVIDNIPTKNLLKLENDIKKIKGVDKVVSIRDITGTTIPLEFLNESIINRVSNGESELMFITFNESTSSDTTLAAVEEIRKLTKDRAEVGGMSAMVLDTKELFNSEMSLYVGIAVMLCIIVLLIFLDSYLVPFLLIANIGIAILFNMGTNIFLGDISYITKAISAVLQLGVTTDFSIFLYHKYEYAKKKYKDNNEAMSNAIVDTLTSVFGSSLTTIAGFLALCTMNLTLGYDIGVVMAKGVLFGLICVITVFPALLLVFDKYVTKTMHKKITPKFTLVKNFVMNHYVIIFLLFIILLVPAYIFQTKTNVYYKLDSSIPDSYGYKKATKILKEDYNIVSQTMILVPSDIENYKLNEMVSKIESLDGVDLVLNPGKISELGISEDFLSEDIKNIYMTDDYKLVLVNSSYDIATDELNKEIDEINKIVDKYDKKAIVAGEGPLMSDLVSITDEDFHNVNYTSIVVIFILMLIVTKSISLPVLLVAAIEFAIFVNMGIPYLMGTKIPFIASVVIGTIQLGATIDYAILMTTKYLEERKKGFDVKSAVRTALDSSVGSIFVSGMCFFAATIGVSIVSKIDMIGTLCTLISRGAIISMIVVICILPSILITFDKLIIKTSLGFRGGKNMRNKLMLVALGLILINPLNIQALSKDETVYANISSSGKVNNVIVTEHLINDTKDKKISDVTNLTNIKNLNGNESFTLDGNNITWDAKEKDIYYQGNSDKELPISVKVSYKLDGKDIKVKELRGKKGHITMTISYTNNLKETVNGKELYTPFIVINEISLSTKNNSNITVTNGKVVSNGTTNIIIAIASPGLSKALDINDIDLDNITIEYDTEKFSKTNINAVAQSKLLDSSDLNSLGDINSISNDINSLGIVANKLVSGTKTLNDGVSELKNGSVKLNDGINEALKGTNQIKNAVDSSIYSLQNDNSSALDEATIEMIKKQAVSGATLTDEQLEMIGMQATNLVKQNETYVSLSDTITKLEANGINESLINVCSSTEIPETYIDICTNNKEYITNYQTAKQMITLMEQISSNTAKQTAALIAQKVASEVSVSVASTVADNVKAEATKKTISSLNSLSTNLGTLSSGLQQLSDGSNQLINGIDKLKTGTNGLYNGVNTFNESGIKKLTLFINNNLISKIDSAKELISLSDKYTSYGMKNEDIKGNTKFIMIIK